MVPERAEFPEALTSSGSVVILNNKREVGGGATPLPFFVLHSVTVGEPWGRPEINDFGLSQDTR